MARLIWATNATVNGGNANTSGGANKDAVIILPDTSTANSGTDVIGSNTVTPNQISSFVGTQTGANVGAIDAESTTTAFGSYHDTNTRLWQIQNFYVMFGPGVTVDLTGWNVQVFDNDDRVAGFQFGGDEGSTILDGSADAAEWATRRAIVIFDRTYYQVFKNRAGSTGDRATASFTMAFNAEVQLRNNPSYWKATGSQTGVDQTGIGMHPQNGNATSGTRGINNNGWSGWNVSSLLQTTDRNAVSNFLKRDADGNILNLPTWRSVNGGTIEWISSQQEFDPAGAGLAKLRLNITGSLDGTTLSVDEFNSGGGVFSVQTPARTFFNQGTGYFIQQAFTGSIIPRPEAADTINISARQHDWVGDGFDIGDASITAGDVTATSNGHIDLFKRVYFDFSKPAIIPDANAGIGVSGSLRAWIRNGNGENDLSNTTRYEENQLIVDTANLNTDGDLVYTPGTLPQNFTTRDTNLLNLQEDADFFYFEGTETNALRVPYKFINDNGSAANRVERTIGEMPVSYVQYPYIPYFNNVDLTTQDWGSAENAASSLVHSLSTPTYISVTRKATVDGYAEAGSAQNAIDRAYSNYLDGIVQDNTISVIENSSDLTNFNLNDSTLGTLSVDANIRFTGLLTDLVTSITSSGTTSFLIDAADTVTGNFTSTNASGTFSSTKSTDTTMDGIITAATIEGDNLIFDGATINGNVDAEGGTFTGATISGTFAFDGDTILNNGNTFNGDITNAPDGMSNQTFGAITITPAAALGNYTNNTFTATGNTTFVIDRNTNITAWATNTNFGNVLFTATASREVEVLSEQITALGGTPPGSGATTTITGHTNITFRQQAAAAATRTYQVPASLRNGMFGVRDITNDINLVAMTVINPSSPATYSYSIVSTSVGSETIRFYWRPNSTATEGYNTTIFDYSVAVNGAITATGDVDLAPNRIASVLWEDVINTDVGTASMSMIGDGEDANELNGVDRAELQFVNSVGVLNDSSLGAARTLFVGLTAINEDLDYIQRMIDNELTVDYIRSGGSDLQVDGAYCYLDSGNDDVQIVTAVTNTNSAVTELQFSPNEFDLTTGGTTPRVIILPNPLGATPGQIAAGSAAGGRVGAGQALDERGLNKFNARNMTTLTKVFDEGDGTYSRRGNQPPTT